MNQSIIRKYGPWLIVILIAITGYSKYSKEVKRREYLETENRKLTEKISEKSQTEETVIETRPDGTTVITTRDTNTTRRTDKSDITDATIYSKEELIRMSKSNYTVGVTVPTSSITDVLKAKQMNFDLGVRIWNLPAFGVLQYNVRSSTAAIGFRVEF